MNTDPLAMNKTHSSVQAAQEALARLALEQNIAYVIKTRSSHNPGSLSTQGVEKSGKQ